MYIIYININTVYIYVYINICIHIYVCMNTYIYNAIHNILIMLIIGRPICICKARCYMCQVRSQLRLVDRPIYVYSLVPRLREGAGTNLGRPSQTVPGVINMIGIG